MRQRSTRSTLFPYTTLFRSSFTVQERGDGPTRIVERTVTRRDAGGRVIAIEKARQANSSTTTIEARILPGRAEIVQRDRKSTRLNSSHSQISYAVFCLKKKT